MSEQVKGGGIERPKEREVGAEQGHCLQVGTFRGWRRWAFP